jgi:DNA-binding transcriptional regulator YbjK
MSPPSPPHRSDEALLTRLRDLSLVDLDALLAGSSGARYGELLTTYAEDLSDALSAARARTRELASVAASGPDPMNLLDASYEARARDGGREHAERVVERLAARAEACRALARIDDLAAHLFPRLLEADRRRSSL